MSINLYIPVIMKLANALLLKVGFSNNFIYKMGSLGSVSVIHSEKNFNCIHGVQRVHVYKRLIATLFAIHNSFHPFCSKYS